MSEWKQLYAEVLDRDPPASLSHRVLTIAAAASVVEDVKASWTRRILIGTVAAAAIAVVLFVLALAAHSRLSAPAPAKPIPTLHPAANGWLAFDGSDQHGSGIFLMRDGGKPHRLDVAGKGATVECPAFSPDGTRLLFGRLTKSGDAQLVIAPVGSDGAIGAATVIPLGGFHVLHGFDPHPCGTWSPDGRWIALAGTGAVWVVDIRTKRIRRLPDLRPSDLEWRPGTNELAIAGDMGMDRGAPTQSTPVTLYSTATDKLRRIGDARAAHITWSPDGKTLAYTGGENDAEPLSLWLVDADGTNNRLFVRDRGGVNHGVGPVWSPAGDRIAYQRLQSDGGEGHEVVLVNVADGTTTTIAPPVTNHAKGFKWWPYAVTWAPDGKTLLYAAWSEAQPGNSGPSGMITVPASHPNDAKMLITEPTPVPNVYSHQWALTQMWGRKPPSAMASAAIRTTGGWQVIDQGHCVNGTQLSFGAHTASGETRLTLRLEIPPATRAKGGHVKVTDGQLTLPPGSEESLAGQAVVTPDATGGAFTAEGYDDNGHPDGTKYAGAWTCRAARHLAPRVSSHPTRRADRCVEKQASGYRISCGAASAIVWVGGRWQVVFAQNCRGQYHFGNQPNDGLGGRYLWFHADSYTDQSLTGKPVQGVPDGGMTIAGTHAAFVGTAIFQNGVYQNGGVFDLNNRGGISGNQGGAGVKVPRADYVGAFTCGPKP